MEVCFEDITGISSCVVEETDGLSPAYMWDIPTWPMSCQFDPPGDGGGCYTVFGFHSSPQPHGLIWVMPPPPSLDQTSILLLLLLACNNNCVFTSLLFFT